jgi:CRP-like cAMP-binding protein
MTDNVVFSGSLRFVSLADVFQLLGGNSCTGILNLRSQYSDYMGIIYFADGNPINASYGNQRGLKAVYELFGWLDGSYEFYEESLSGIDHVIKKGRMEMVLDALRMLDDGVIKKVGPQFLNQLERKPDSAESGRKDYPPRIKGPLVDYIYVIREEFYDDGASIVREGKFGKWLWVVYQGTVRVTKNTAKGPLTLARLGEGCFIGTIRALLFGEYERSATVTAEGKVRLCILDAEPLYHEYSLLSENFRKVLLSLDKRLRMLDEKAVQAYTDGNANNKLSKDRVFLNKFQSETDLYLIQDGAADIVAKGPEGDFKLLSLNNDDIFGRVPFMDFGHEPESASVMVSNSMKADKLDSRAIQQEYNNLTHTFRNFIFNMGTNISMTTNLLYQLMGKA